MTTVECRANAVEPKHEFDSALALDIDRMMLTCEGSSKKPERKTLEKNRRIHMKGLCYKLNSLIPSLSSQPFKLTTQENQFDQATAYIKQLRKRIELLKEKRDQALRLVNNGRNNDASCSIESKQKAVSSWLPTVEVKEFEGALQVFLTSNFERKFSLPQVVRIVEDGGGEVVKGGYTIVGDKVIYTIHAKARVTRIGVDVTGVHKELQELINGSSCRSRLRFQGSGSWEVAGFF
ncbi:achaete-scute transcription factor-related protein [Artemisia annua]|uniref:Achaete-scute transcription factor-related protein n=1 Tax=Artemisia annua TaxID=35608 RepID=A0A2U1N022_ARTAN|nr:achaete-scute transcription factor-related protein [Artemisia annua]